MTFNCKVYKTNKYFYINCNYIYLHQPYKIGQFTYNKIILSQVQEMNVTYTLRKVDLNNARDVRSFIDLPLRIYRRDGQWVPPLRIDIKRLLNKQKNPFFAHSDAEFFLVIDQSGSPVSRLACLNNSRYNTHNHEATAFFYLFESKNNIEASTLLFTAAFDWARRQGLNKIIGPKGFTPLDGFGLMVAGFDQSQVYGVPYNPPWYSALVEQAGFSPANELLSGTVDRQTVVNPKIDLIANRAKERMGLRTVSFRSKKQIRDAWPIVLEQYNKAIKGTSDNYPIDAREAKEMTKWISLIADLKLIKLIVKDDLVIGFVIAYPDVSDAIKKIRGELFPFGWLKILIHSHRTQKVCLNAIGIIEEYRGLGGTAVLFSEISKTLYDSRYTRGELFQLDRNNDRMVHELSNIGVKFHMKHQIYEKTL